MGNNGNRQLNVYILFMDKCDWLDSIDANMWHLSVSVSRISTWCAFDWLVSTRTDSLHSIHDEPNRAIFGRNSSSDKFGLCNAKFNSTPNVKNKKKQNEFVCTLYGETLFKRAWTHESAAVD